MKPVCLLTSRTQKRLMTQGYRCYSDEQLRDYRFGIRFAYALCGMIVLFGLVFNNIPLLLSAAVVAFFGAFPPRHPFDYLYNNVVCRLLHKPKIPPRTAQGRFACAIATIWLSATVYLLLNHQVVAGYVFGIILLCSATLVSTTDICIPSMIYHWLWKRPK